MSQTLSIQGPQAVGKTTVLTSLQKKLPAFTFLFENPQPIVEKRDALGLDISTKSGFVENQRLFIQAEIRRWQSLPKGPVVFDRGPEDTECFTCCYPIVYGKEWDLETELEAELAMLRSCRPDRLLYLKARDHVLISRRARDETRSRRSFDVKAFGVYEDWYRRNLNPEVLDISDLSIDEVEAAVEQWITEGDA